MMGVEWRPDLHDSLLSVGRDGEYAFPSVFDFLSDSPNFLRITLNRQTGLPAADSDFRRYYFQNEGAAFVQDNWKQRRVWRACDGSIGARWDQDYNYVLGPKYLADRVQADRCRLRSSIVRPQQLCSAFDSPTTSQETGAPSFGALGSFTTGLQ